MALKSIAVAASALFIAVGAQATSAFTASLSDFGAVVTQGSVSWTPSAEDQDLFVRLYANSSDVNASPVNDAMTFGSPFSTMSLNSTGTVSSASASATANSLSISLSTPAAGGSAYAFASWESHFNLAANSNVVFSWVTSHTGSLVGGPGSYAYTDVALGNSVVSAQVIGRGYAPGASFDYELAGVGYKYWSEGGRQFAAISTGATGADNLGFFARVQGHAVDVAAGPTGGITTAVPEPGSIALALSGLAVLGFATRRRAAA
jgi:PEP-CTERM motif